MGFVNKLRSIVLRLLVRASVQGQDYLSPAPRTLFILETDRATHRLLLLQQLKKHRNTVPAQQILSTAFNQRDLLRNRLESQVERLEFLAQNEDIQIVPVSIYHGRMPQREHGWLNLLYAETWHRAGIIGRLMQLLVNGRQTLIQIDPPLSLKQLKQSSPHQPAGVVAHKAARVFDSHFHQRRLAIIGPDLSHRHTLINLILQREDIRTQIHLAAHANGISDAEATAEARTILDGIAANFSPTTARVLSRLLGWFWKHTYRKIEVLGVEKAQAVAPNSQLVYLPCHRSHMDYVLLSWSLYEHGLMIPHIAAGDNLNAPLLGSILKRGGAVFMRRRFLDDALYTALFRAYLVYMANRGHALEYFIEGGRSRTGRLLPAKTGLLRMTLENHRDNPKTPVTLIPVWISYDKLVESRTYQKELSGAQKRRESMWGLLLTLRQFRRQLGDTALSFGDPIALSAQTSATQDINVLTADIGRQVMTHINRAAYANETALLGTVLLATPGLRLARTALAECAQALAALLPLLPNAPAGVAQGHAERWIDDALKREQLSCDEDGQIFLTAAQTQELAFYRNQLHHITVLPGIYLLLTHRHPKPSPQTLPRLLAPVYPYLQAELFLPWAADKTTGAYKQTRLALEKQGLLLRAEKAMVLADTALSQVLIRNAEKVLLRYYLVLHQVAKHQQCATETLISESQRIAEQLHREFGFYSPEYTDSKVLEVYLRTLAEQGVISINDGQIEKRIDLAPVLRRARQLLSRAAVSYIDKVLHPR